MGTRLELQSELENILGSRNVYFQPPENVKINYPCIIYSRNNINKRPADNIPYLTNVEYKVIVIDKDPDSEIVERMARFRYARFGNHYTADGLNHDIFYINY